MVRHLTSCAPVINVTTWSIKQRSWEIMDWEWYLCTKMNAMEKTWCDFCNDDHYGNKDCMKKFPKKACVERRCPKCSVENLIAEINSVITPEFIEKIAACFSWRNVEVGPKKHQMWSVPTTTTLENLLEEYLEELEGLSQHYLITIGCHISLKHVWRTWQMRKLYWSMILHRIYFETSKGTSYHALGSWSGGITSYNCLLELWK